MINAKQAREQTANLTAIIQRNQLNILKTMTENKIAAALKRGQCLIDMTVPADADETLVNAYRNVLRKLGYRANLTYELGYVAEGGVYIAPKTTLTVGW